MRRFAAAILLASACTAAPVTTVPSPSLSAVPTATPTFAPSVVATPTAAPATPSPTSFPGAIVSAPITDQMLRFGSQSRSLIAIWSAGTPPPYQSRLLRADADGSWATFFESDAAYVRFNQDQRRAAFIEYREKPQGGGASDQTLLVIDLSTRALSKIDSFALSPATYRGGGAAPRGPAADIVIGGAMVAWTRINELSGGVIEGELRLATLANPGSSIVVGKSREAITPIAVDENTLVYLVGGADRDELRARDHATRKERTLAQVQRPTQTSGPSILARSGKFVGWIEMPTPTETGNSRFRSVHLESGALRELDLGAPHCAGFSANDYGFVWTCGDPRMRTSLGYFDPAAWRTVDVTTATDGLLEAALDGFIWTGLVGGVRRAVLLAPR